jgi:hypothetical protein
MRTFRLLSCVLVVTVAGGCGLFPHRLVSHDYGFSVEFPGSPVEQSSRNYEGLPRSLWTLENDSAQEFFSAEATSYQEPLNPSPNWIPAETELSSVGVETMEARHFKMRSATGREVAAIATRSRQTATGAIIASIYVVDGRTLISITARSPNEHRRAAFLDSLRILR